MGLCIPSSGWYGHADASRQCQKVEMHRDLMPRVQGRTLTQIGSGKKNVRSPGWTSRLVSVATCRGCGGQIGSPSVCIPRAKSSRTHSGTRINASGGESSGKKQQMLVYVPPHPLVKHWMAVMRSKETPPVVFRTACAELGRILMYEALREMLPTIEAQVETPISVADVAFVDPSRPIKFVPILRAGLVLLESCQTLVPVSETYHIGFVRDEETLEASCYLNKLPAVLDPSDLFIVSDVMLATGGTMVQVLQDMVSRGADPTNIRVVSALAAPPALQKLNDAFPGLIVYTGMIDAEVNERGYIVPGVGDAGDRAFGTTK